MQSLSTFKKKGHRLPPFNERSVKEFVAIFNPPQKLTEREMYLISKIHERLVALVAGIYKGPLQTKKRTAAPKKKKMWTKTVQRKCTEVGTNKQYKEMLKIIGSQCNAS